MTTSGAAGCLCNGLILPMMGKMRCSACARVYGIIPLAAKEPFKFYAEDFCMMTSPNPYAKGDVANQDQAYELRIVRECDPEEFKHLPNMKVQWYYGICNTPPEMGKVRVYELQIYPAPDSTGHVEAKHLRTIH